MEPEQIAAEIGQLREGIDHSSRRIYELSRTLYDRVRRRRHASGANAGNNDVYVTYAMAWTRFAGMVQQGLTRTRQSDRLLGMITEETPPEATPREQAAAHPQPVAVQAHTMPTEGPEDDFITLDLVESVRDADRQRPR
jgi:hypothetical protein